MTFIGFGTCQPLSRHKNISQTQSCFGSRQRAQSRLGSTGPRRQGSDSWLYVQESKPSLPSLWLQCLFPTGNLNVCVCAFLLKVCNLFILISFVLLKDGRLPVIKRETRLGISSGKGLNKRIWVWAVLERLEKQGRTAPAEPLPCSTAFAPL